MALPNRLVENGIVLDMERPLTWIGQKLNIIKLYIFYNLTLKVVMEYMELIGFSQT